MKSSMFDGAWIGTLERILRVGDDVAPRGKPTREILQHTVAVPMRQPVLTVKERHLHYGFMAAEAYWILSGSNLVEEIAPWNRHIAQFSDDGRTFFGAYGPKVVGQLDYVVKKLIEDSDTRQAGMTIWRENPPATKDVPCTVAIFASLRQGRVNLHVFMRSSDAWLGLPYDVFNFSMLGHLISARVNAYRGGRTITPGWLYLTAASSHLYETNWEAAKICVESQSGTISSLPSASIDTPPILCYDEAELMERLRMLRDSQPGNLARWWEA